MASYIMSIGCIALKRIRSEPLLPSNFNLGSAGLPLNLVSLVFLVFVFFFSFWPVGRDPAPVGMNWTSLIFAVAMIASLAYYWAKGRHVYVGPVEYVRKSA
jgi:choline transport protein